MKRSVPTKRGGPLRRSKKVRPRNRKRQAANHNRAYGCEHRLDWIRHQPCSVCGRSPCDNAHTESGGTGRKADAKTVIPLCSGAKGCHRELHQVGVATFELEHRIRLKSVAVNVEATWQRVRTCDCGHDSSREAD